MAVELCKVVSTGYSHDDSKNVININTGKLMIGHKQMMTSYGNMLMHVHCGSLCALIANFQYLYL